MVRHVHLTRRSGQVYEAQTGRPFGTAAEFVVVPTLNAVRLPDNVSFDVGASVGIAAMTAHRCLFADGDLRGKRVLVHGGAGVVGSAAIMLAKWAGAWVCATVIEPEHAALAITAGADLVVNPREQDLAAILRDETDGKGVDRIVDVDLARNLEVNLACLANAGVISAYAVADAASALPLPLLQAMIGGAVLRFVYIYTVPKEAKRAALADITACLNAGAYRPEIALRLPLDRIVEAHEAMESRRIPGKILVITG